MVIDKSNMSKMSANNTKQDKQQKTACKMQNGKTYSLR